ncbi:MAG: ADOP family duplicated permease [Betaproteobacteria bacterium]
MALSRFFRRGRWDDERAEELRSYLEHEIDDNLARGMDPDAARGAARRKLGNETRVREEIYEMNTMRLVDAAWQDVRFGLRLLRRNPAFAAVAILSLALGIGANTAIFQLLDSVRLRELPVTRPGELAEVTIETHDNGFTGHFEGRHIQLTWPLYQQIREQQRAFTGLAAWGIATFNLSTGGARRPADGMWVSGNLFDVLGVPALLGRTLTDADDQRGCGSPAAVLGYGFWQREYGGDASAIGRTLRLDGHPFQIVGVTPASFFGVEVGHTFDVAVPMCSEALIRGADSLLDRPDGWFIAAVGRLKHGWTAAQASAQLGALSSGIMRTTLPRAYTPDDTKNYLAFTLTASSMRTGVSSLRREYETPLWLLLGISGTVLLIACANLANLMLARGSARRREMAIRLAMGASRRRVIRQLLAESAMLAVFGAAAGALLAGWLSRALVAFLSTASEAFYLPVAVDWRVLAFTAGLAAATCLVFGLMPALRATRTTPGAAMKASGRGLTDARERFGFRRALVVGQVALSLVLVVGALLFVRTFRNLLTLDAGFQQSGVLIVRTDLRGAGAAPERYAATNRELLDRIRAIPGVEAAASARIVPLSGALWNEFVLTDGAGQKAKQLVNFNAVSPGFFRTLGTPLVAGRDFDAHDLPSSPKVAIVNETFVRKVLGPGDPLGRTFSVEALRGGAGETFLIVGLVKDTKYGDLREAFTPIAFVPASQDEHPGPFGKLFVRSRLPLVSLTASATRAVADVDPQIVVDFEALRTRVENGLVRERLMATLSGFFGVLAGLLAVVGLYGVMSYMVARRRNEIGIRMALGADRGAVVWMVMREAGTLLAAGLCVGLLLAVAAAQSARALLFGLGPGDPATLALAAGGLAAVAAIAGYLPAARAARLDPTEALRDE